MKKLFTDQNYLMAKVLDFRLERQNVVMSNLANMMTPGYRARRLEFEKELQAALQQGGAAMVKTNDKHMPVPFAPDEAQAGLGREFRPNLVQGQDSVDLDKEMAILAKNTMLYNAIASVLRKDFEGMQKVISEGGR
ncbi:MAG: flagellar basal body rod protein FlgB [Desulfovibrionales bacterium]